MAKLCYAIYSFIEGVCWSIYMIWRILVGYILQAASEFLAKDPRMPMWKIPLGLICTLLVIICLLPFLLYKTLTSKG